MAPACPKAPPSHSPSSSAAGRSHEADLVLYNANVITMGPGGLRAQAVAIKEGRIAAVGCNDDAAEQVFRRY